MIDAHNKKEMKTNSSVSPLAAGIAGVIVGGATVAAAFVMSDKDNQKKVKNAVDTTKEKINTYIRTVKSKPVIRKNLQKIDKVVEDVQERLDKRA